MPTIQPILLVNKIPIFKYIFKHLKNIKLNSLLSKKKRNLKYKLDFFVHNAYHIHSLIIHYARDKILFEVRPAGGKLKLPILFFHMVINKLFVLYKLYVVDLKKMWNILSNSRAFLGMMDFIVQQETFSVKILTIIAKTIFKNFIFYAHRFALTRNTWKSTGKL